MVISINEVDRGCEGLNRLQNIYPASMDIYPMAYHGRSLFCMDFHWVDGHLSGHPLGGSVTKWISAKNSTCDDIEKYYVSILL